jgi:hypothetical protein
LPPGAAAACACLPAHATEPLLLHCCRFEELEYADAATYMEDGQVVFSGSPAELKQYIKRLGAVV